MAVSHSCGPALQCAGRALDLGRPLVMGVINTTPDSFSDGGTLYRSDQLNLDLALERAKTMVESGADIIDIGGESTRPGAAPVGETLEMDRVLPLLQRISTELDVVVSIDTSTPALMSEAAAQGAGLINDVRALRRPGAMEAAARSGLPVCLMHMQGEPGSMQRSPEYGDVLTDVGEFLKQRIAACCEAGIPRERVMLDPGFGFGKSVQHNLALLAGLPQLAAIGLPLLVGLSRKSLIGQLIGRDVDQRMPASIALAVLAAERGAAIIRTHDVAETSDALAMYSALSELKSQ
ncbi:MAG: dihydropteroate synthase [Halieaceae bacterium]|nr:dihydropteroate synthase [Halieaceae bacterium]